MKQVVVVGAGKIGSIVAELLAGSGDYRVTIADRDAAQLTGLSPAIGREAIDIGDADALQVLLKGRFAVISAAPYHLTCQIASAAKAAGAHYLDLTEDVAATRAVRVLAEGAETAFIPQCGLAPGFVSIVAHDMASRFDTLHDVRLRVGALPIYPSNALSYNLTWSTEGLINEYCEPCEAIVHGERRDTAALEELEGFALDGVAYEAFNTSGGLGSLCETLAGRVRNLNYRTIRYPGHAAILKLLLNDLGLRRRRDVLKEILETNIPETAQDVVVVFVTVSGLRAGRLVQETYAHKVYAGEVRGIAMSAIQATTASSICAVLDLLAEGAIPAKGLVRQEEIALAAFLDNRFGRVYARAVDARPGDARPGDAWPGDAGPGDRSEPAVRLEVAA